MNKRRLEAKQKRKRPLLCGEACTHSLQEECAVLFWKGGRKYTERKEPIPAAHPQPCPAVPHHSPPLPLAKTKGLQGAGTPRPAPRRRLPGQLPLQTLDLSLRVSWRFGSHQEPQVAPQEQAASSVLPGGRPRPAPNQSTPELPTSQPSPCPLLPHSPPGGSGIARLGPAGPRWGQGRDHGARGTGRTPGARRRAGALAPALPHRPQPLRTPTRTHGRRAPSRLRGGRERGSARNPWNEAPPALSRALPGSAGPRPRARPSSPAGGGRAQVRRRRGGGRASRARGRLISPPPPAPRLTAARTYPTDADVLGRPTSAWGPGCNRPRGAREPSAPGVHRPLTHTGPNPRGPGSGNTALVHTHEHKRTSRARPEARRSGPARLPLPRTHTVGSRTRWTQHT